jgi:putative NADPH-quinone reductase
LQDAEPVVPSYYYTSPAILKEYISGVVTEDEQELNQAVKKAGSMVSTGGRPVSSTTSNEAIVTSKVE